MVVRNLLMAKQWPPPLVINYKIGRFVAVTLNGHALSGFQRNENQSQRNGKLKPALKKTNRYVLLKQRMATNNEFEWPPVVSATSKIPKIKLTSTRWLETMHPIHALELLKH